jgi:Putative Ig domain
MSTRRHCVTTTITLMMLVLATASWARAGVTSIVLNSDPGDYIGGGQTLVFVDTDGAFAAQSFGNGNAVRVSFNTPTYSHWWYLEFAAPDLLPLVVGPYEGAVRYPFQGSGQPGLSVSGDGRGCNTLTGRFDVRELVLGGADEVVSFRATFEQHCEGFAPALRGEVRYNATVPLQLTAPSTVTALENQLLNFNVSAVVTQGGGHVTLSASNLPLGASFVDHGDNTGTFSWTPLSSQAGTYLVRIQGTTGALVETAYVRITVMLTPPPNDEIENAIPISGLPFTHTQNTTTATVAPDDPFCYGTTASVWFTYTPIVGGRVELNTVGSNYATTLSAYTGTRGNLSQLACNYNGSESRIRFDATPGVTYYIMAGAPPWSAPGSLTLNVLSAPPPFTMQLTLDTFSIVDASSGAVIVKGTTTCSAPSFVFVNGSIRQQHAGRELLGYFGAFVPCDGVTPWEAPVSYLTGGTFSGRASALFVAGNADVTASASAYDPVEGTYVFRNATARVRLRGGH